MAHNSQSTHTSGGAAVPAMTAANTVMTHHAQPIVIIQRQAGGGCDCSVPPNASQAVKATRWSSIAIIIIHALALGLLGFWALEQWVASLIGIIMGGVLLCTFNKCCYITASVLYSIGIFFDVIAAVCWLHYGPALVAIPPILGGIAFLIGAIAGCIATCNWDDSVVVDMPIVQNGLAQVHSAGIPSAQTSAVQPNHTFPVAKVVP